MSARIPRKWPAIILALACACVAGLDAMAQGPGPSGDPNLAGRWASSGRHTLAIDISRCGAGWCGVMVENDGVCGFKGLQLAPNGEPQAVIPSHPHRAYKGEMKLSATGQTYRVSATAAAGAGGEVREFWIAGAPLDAPPMTRFMPLNLRLVRAGEARCSSDRPVS